MQSEGKVDKFAGPVVQNLTKLLANNDSLKFTSSDTQIC